MGFTKNFESDPLGERIYVLVHGEPKIGKARLVLDLVKRHGDFVVLLSLDKGTLAVRQEPLVYKGKLAIAYPNGLREIRADMREAQTTIAKLAKKVSRANIWVVLDTVTHLQSRLIAEARKINVSNPDAKDTREDYVRDAVVEVDWGINLAHMSEIADFLVNVKANVVVTALSKRERVKREETGRDVPALSGQSYSRFMGDADAILHLKADKEGARFLEVTAGDALNGDRSGNLDEREPANLKLIQRKMIGWGVPVLPDKTVGGASNENGADAVTPAP